VPGLWFEAQESWEGADVTQLKVTVPVDKLDGGKNKMNRDLRDALKFPEFQTIQFTWEQISFIDETETGRRAEVEGSVTIAGETKKISFDADLSLNESSQIIASGNVKLNMEEYGVKAPTAFFGVIRTDKIVNLSFEIFLEEE
jgi:polyisoprenoid-binding protein YceI